MSLARRLELEVQHDARDTREPWEKLRDLVNEHLANAERFNAVCAACETMIDKGSFAEAEKRYLNSQSDLFVAVEDVFCLPAETVARALSA